MHTAAMKKYVKLTLLFVFSSHEFISHVEPESPSHIVISANTQNALYFMFFLRVFAELFETMRCERTSSFCLHQIDDDLKIKILIAFANARAN